MAAFCGACGKPLAEGGKFCGGCGAAQPVPANVTPPTAPAKSGSPALKILIAVVLLVGAALLMAAAGIFFVGRKKLAEWRKDSGVSSPASPAGHSARSGGAVGAALLTKEEMGDIIGVPVVSIEMTGQSDASYKTATEGMDAGIEIERKDGESDAIQSFQAARQITQRMFGGKGETIADLGDDAIYGAFNVLYVRKNDLFLTITPPNLQQVAQLQQYSNLTSQPLGSDGQKKALEQLQETMKGDPASASLAKPDAVSGATDLIQHAAADRGNEYEAKARLMARQMAEKVLAKIGA